MKTTLQTIAIIVRASLITFLASFIFYTKPALIKAEEKEKVVDSLQNEKAVDSLQNEIMLNEMDIQRYETAIDMLEEKNPKAGKEIRNILNNIE